MTGDLVGTLRYMSPEQALAKRVIVDHRTDIYSLGATLYELLTLEPAYPGNDRQELLRQIAFEEPKPLRRIKKSIPDELETIVLKAMEKSPADRYGTAQELADDLRRYLQHEPIRAKKPKLFQRLGKWSRRHPAFVRSASLILLLITAGSLLSTWLIWQEKQRTGEEYKRAQDEKRIARRENQIAQAVRDFLQHLLGQADIKLQADSLLEAGKSSGDAKRNPTIRELLDRAVTELTPERMEANFPDQPLVQAEILRTVGESYHGVGEYSQAINHIERSVQLYEAQLGRDDPHTLDTLGRLAAAYQKAGRLPEAILLLEQVREKREERFELDLNVLDYLAQAYNAANRLQEAIDLFEQLAEWKVQKFGRYDPSTLNTLSDLGGAYHDAGRVAEAIRLLEKVKDVADQKLGSDHLVTMNTLGKLGVAYLAAGRLPEAIRLLEQTREKMENKLGLEHSLTLVTLNNLALAYQRAGRLPEAIHVYEQIRPIQELKLGKDHHETLTTLSNLGEAYRNVGKVPEAIGLLEQAREKYEQICAPDNPDTLTTVNNLALAYWSAGQLDRSVPMLEELLPRRRAKSGDDHPDTFAVAFNLGTNYRDAGRLDDAVRIFDQWLPSAECKLQPDQFPLPAGRSQAAETYERAKRFDRLVPLRETAVADARRTFGQDDPKLAGALASLSFALLKVQKDSDAEKILHECLAIREKKEPDVWTTFNTQSMLGGALIGQRNYAAAEPLLIHGYEGMRQREAKVPPKWKRRLTEGLERLVQLYEAWDKPDLAAQWRKKLDEQKTKDQLPPPPAKEVKKDLP
jgi:tetratricopeptide (TPR) repeat protein